MAIKFLPERTIKSIRDEKDNRFLASAEIADTGFLIMGNTNDFTLLQYGKVEIVTPA
jgi:predicted nucleic acid-binding protein